MELIKTKHICRAGIAICAFLLYLSHMTDTNIKKWEKPNESELGDAKSIIKGFGPGDPKVGGDGDDALSNASDV